MTRINLIDVKYLTNKHLLSEWRELPRVFGDVQKRIEKGKEFNDVPPTFRLNTGHVKFFYDKLTFLSLRHTLLVDELLSRGYKLNIVGNFDLSLYPSSLCNDFSPSPNDVSISAQRLLERVLTQKHSHPYYTVDYLIGYYQELIGDK